MDPNRFLNTFDNEDIATLSSFVVDPKDSAEGAKKSDGKNEDLTSEFIYPLIKAEGW